MNKIAATPIYGKNLQKSSSPEPVVRLQWNLICSIGDVNPSYWVDLYLFYAKVKFCLIFKLNFVFLKSCWVISNKIPCERLLEYRNENLYKWYRSHDQDGGHALIWLKILSNIFFSITDCNETWYVALKTLVHHSLFNLWPLSDLGLLYAKVKFGRLGFCIGKKWKLFFIFLFFFNFYSVWSQRW